MKRGQSWSIELTATIMIFLFALTIFASLVLKKDNSTERLSADAEKTINRLSANTADAIIDDNQLNKTRAANLNYSDLKKDLGLTNKVCIYFEDKNGRLISIDGKNAVGDSSIKINGQDCANNS